MSEGSPLWNRRGVPVPNKRGVPLNRVCALILFFQATRSLPVPFFLVWRGRVGLWFAPPPQNALKKLAKYGDKKKEKKQWSQPPAGDKAKKEKKKEKKAEVSFRAPTSHDALSLLVVAVVVSRARAPCVFS